MALNVICSLRAEKEGKMEAKEKIRKYYEKPRINEVKLEIEEAVLAACKVTTSGTGKASPPKCSNTSCQSTLGS